MANVTIYKSDGCGHCKQLVPVIKRNAKARGDKVTVKDIDRCHTDDCNSVAFTPLVVRNGKELSEAQLRPYLKGAGK